MVKEKMALRTHDVCSFGSDCFKRRNSFLSDPRAALTNKVESLGVDRDSVQKLMTFVRYLAHVRRRI